MLNASQRRVNKNSLTWWYVLKTSWRYLCKTSWKCLEDVLKTPWRRFKDVLKTSWRRLEDIWPRQIYWSWPRRLEDVFWRRKAKANIFVLIKTSWRRLEDVFWRRKAKANIFALIKTSSRRLLKTKTKDVFKTSSIRLHQDECLPGYFTEHLSLTTFVPWILQSQSIIYSIYSVEVVRESNLCWLSGKVISIKAWYWWENFTNNFSCRTEQIVRGTDVIIFDT